MPSSRPCFRQECVVSTIDRTHRKEYYKCSIGVGRRGDGVPLTGFPSGGADPRYGLLRLWDDVEELIVREWTRRYVPCAAVLIVASSMLTTSVHACGISVEVYRGHGTLQGGAPYSGLAGSLVADEVMFATATGYNWHPFGLSHFGARIAGTLHVAATGTYRFTLDSDNGSLLYIDDRGVVLDNGGRHEAQTVSSNVSLSAGRHFFQIQFYEDYGGKSGVDLLLPPGVTYGKEPIISKIQDERIAEHVLYKSSPPVLESGAYPVTWSLVDPPHEAMSINSQTGVVSWSDPILRPEPYRVTVRAENGCGNSQATWLLTVCHAYSATVKADVEEACAGTPVAFTGQAIQVDNRPAAGVEVVIHVTTKGIRRRLPPVMTDESGHFKTVWQPFVREAGRYHIWADHPEIRSEPPEAEFVLFGADIEPNVVDHRIIAGQRISRSVAIRNVGDVELSGLSARVENAPAHLTVEPECPTTLGPNATASLKYSVTATDDTLRDGQFDVVVSHKQTPVARLHVRVEVIPVSPVLRAYPHEIAAGMVRGGQTLVDLEIVNVGGSPSDALTVDLPADAAWMSLVTPAAVGPLDPNESTPVTVSLMPDESMPLQSYEGDLVIGDGQADVRAPFHVDCVSAAVGRLTVTAVDELTFHASGKPNVAGAHVTVVNAYTGHVAGSADTNDTGVADFSNLAGAYYNLEVTADSHGAFCTTLRISAGSRTQVTAFLPRQLVTYRWTVLPGETRDHYDLTVEAASVSNVPVPVVTVEPLLLDLCGLREEDTDVKYTITNHGLLAARNVRLAFMDCAGFEFTPLVDTIDLPAQTSVEVLVRVHNSNLSSGLPGPCDDGNRCAVGEHELSYRLTCGQSNLLYRIPFFAKAFAGAGYEQARGGGIVGSGPGVEGGDGRGSSRGSRGEDQGHEPVDQIIPCPSCDARVRIRLGQEAVVTRDAFIATLELDNNRSKTPLEKIEIALVIRDEQGRSSEYLFDIDPPQLAGIGDVDGGGSLPAGRSAAAEWLIVPAPQAACEEPRRYDVRGELAYVVAGEQVRVPLYPASILVLPNPQLEVKYFLERDVYSDDPFTDPIEPAEPFSLGMMMTNHGCGAANDVAIVSSQPRIVEDERQRLLDFKITGTRVGPDDVPPSLNVRLGDIPSEGCTVVQWTMQSSLQGCFEDYDANFVYVDGLGDRRLALVDQGSFHELAHVVRAACPNDDGAPDFLTNSQETRLPDALHRSDGSVMPVATISHTLCTIGVLGNRVHLTVPAATEDCFYVSFPDTFLCASPLKAVTRSDGVTIPIGENVWTTRRSVRRPGQPPYEENLLHLFDCGGPGGYVLEYVNLPRLTLEVSYFVERHIYGDDPCTNAVEPAAPFSLGLIVRNRGHATAMDLWVVSPPPQIVDHANRPLPDPNVVGVSVGPDELAPSAQVRIGDLEVDGYRVIRWMMQSSLEGRLDSWQPEFFQVDALGGRYPVDVNRVGIHELEHAVRATWPSDDGACEFLTYASGRTYGLPDTLYLSDGSVWPEPVAGRMNMVHQLVRIRDHLEIRLAVVDMPDGYFYVRYPDPTDGKLTLVAVTRSDGVSIPVGANAWTTRRTVREQGWQPYEQNFLHLFDYGGPGTYTFEYEIGDWKSLPWPEP